MRHTLSHILPAGLALAALAGLGLLVHDEAALTAFDRTLSDGIIALRNPPLDWGVVLITLFGDGTALTMIAVAVVVTLLVRRAWWPAGICAAAFSLTPLIVKAVKLTVARARPTADLYAGVESFSFPSGHMTNSMVIYGALAIFAVHALTGLRQRLAVGGFILLITLMGLSRIYLGAHWPSDVIGAVLLASVMLFLIAWGFDQMPGRARFARPYGVVIAVMLAIWTVYAVVTIEAAMDLYAVDVSPEGTIELDADAVRN
ncbi:phosphatase PAP2 family protein [Henriciella aquimarina]|uniref:phosphatase PAP2 family protein n=1 Tax=Henriciella aquimarina TaxID=545261 RepID=UPI0009FD4460|nr:phosphatase PAP2 family protein [Henriciella aquimarina]